MMASRAMHPSRPATDDAMTDLAGSGALHAGRPPLPPRYRLGTLLGAGGMAEVWQAHDEQAGRAVAVKVLKGSAAGRADLRRRLEREARVIGQLAHPGIVRILDVFGCDDGRPAFSMELLRGETFRELLQREGPLAVPRTLGILLPVIDAMGAAHAAGVVHRDLKPENIFLAATDGPPQVRVLDFGLARLMPGTAAATGSLLTEATDVLGTPPYMAPEQVAAGAVVDQRADVWALGVMLYECLSGARPVEGATRVETARRILVDAIVPLGLIAPSTPPRVTRLVMQMLSRDPGERPADLATVGAVLADAAGGH
jgi:eukaryotic-like serine/threonine-protein kinase